MSTRETLSLATRRSDLALRQSASVQSVLEDYRYNVELLEVETTGDQIRDELIQNLGKTGAFVRSLDERVLSSEADAAVHSMKDVPTDMPDELTIAAIPERERRNDVLVSPDGAAIDDLPSNATVGTSSLRRKAQLLAVRPDIDVQPLRGNVDTRIKKLLAPSLQAEHEKRLEAEESDDDTGESFDQDLDEWFNGLAEIEREALEQEVSTEYDAIVLAEAGLRRSGLLRHLNYQRLPESDFVPAPGQGAIAVSAADKDVIEIIRTHLDDAVSRTEVIVERTILSELGGGCVAPLGISAVVQGQYVHTTVHVLSQDASDVILEARDLPIERHREAAIEFANSLREKGAADIIEAAKKQY